MFHHSFQMEQKFHQATSSRLVPASSLVVGRRYPILGGERAETRFGPTIIFRLTDSNSSIIKICLPKRYANVLTDDELNTLNTGSEAYDLISEGMCQNALVLTMTTRRT